MHYLNVSVATLLHRHPWAEEVLEWHGVTIDDSEACLSLSALCWLHRLDASQIVRDLNAARDDDDVSYDELMAFLTYGDEPVTEWDDPPTIDVEHDPATADPYEEAFLEAVA